MARIKPSNFQVNSAKEFMFDTNVWILLFAPNGNYQRDDQKSYSDFFEIILEKNASIYINSIILSEYANSLLRRDFELWKKNENSKGNFECDFKKNFFKTEEYLNSYKNVKSSLERIFEIPNIIKLSDDFSSTEFSNVIRCCPDLDFNDSYIAHLANRKKVNFVSNDSDFNENYLDYDLITTK